jgi:hypothetical protein
MPCIKFNFNSYTFHSKKEGEDYVSQLNDLCGALHDMNGGIPYILAGALALFLLQTIITVRHHVFFERAFYEQRLALRNDELADQRDVLDELSALVDVNGDGIVDLADLSQLAQLGGNLKPSAFVAKLRDEEKAE